MQTTEQVNAPLAFVGDASRLEQRILNTVIRFVYRPR